MLRIDDAVPTRLIFKRNDQVATRFYTFSFEADAGALASGHIHEVELTKLVNALRDLLDGNCTLTGVEGVYFQSGAKPH